MSEIDKQIDCLLNRFDNVLFSDKHGEEGGEFAFDEAVNFFIQYPQYLFVVERLNPQLTHTCPNGTKRTLRIDEDYSLNDSDSSCFIGNEEFADRQRLSIVLTLPAQKNDKTDPTPKDSEKETNTTESTPKEAGPKKKKERPEVTAIKSFIATFARSQDFNGYIAIEFK